MDKEPPYRYRRRKLRGVVHTVRKGETLWQIANAYGMKLDYLAKVNWIKDVDRVRAGQKIFIPGAKKVVEIVPPGRKLARRIKEAAPEEKRPDPGEKHKQRTAFVPRGGGFFDWPLKGEIASKFGMRWENKHEGIDVSAPEGTHIRAAAPGKVIYSDNKMRYYGNVVIIKHQGGYFSIYAHNSANLVEEGSEVVQGQVIAKVGSSGRSSAPHLHFEIRKGERPINPLLYLPSR